ncbi:MAG: RDD family protein [Elusimicrobiota bacterium]
MPAGFWLRFLAALLDLILVLDAAVLMSPWALWAAPLYWALAGTRWNTLGKRLTGIRVVRLDGSPAGYFRCLLRALLCPLGIHNWAARTKVVLEGDKTLARRVYPALGLCVALNLPAYHIYRTFMDLLRVSAEGATQSNLGAIRSALNIYNGDMEGLYPADPLSLTLGGKYLKAIPPTRLKPYHPETSSLRMGKTPADTGGWLYNNDAGDKEGFGSVSVDCTHTDHRGSIWSEY